MNPIAKILDDLGEFDGFLGSLFGRNVGGFRGGILAENGREEDKVLGFHLISINSLGVGLGFWDNCFIKLSPNL